MFWMPPKLLKRQSRPPGIRHPALRIQKNSADSAAQSELRAKHHADSASLDAQKTASDVAAATAARADAEHFASEAGKNAQASETARDESVDAAERARGYQDAASLAATRAGQASDNAQGHENNAAEYARQAKASQDVSAGNAQEAKQYRDEAQQIVDGLNVTNATTTQKGLVQLSNATDSDSEELAATPTPADDATGLEMANAAFVRKLIVALVGSSPEAQDTLNELAVALGNDPSFATTVTNALAGKQPLNDTLTSISKAALGQNTFLYFGNNFEAEAILCSNKARSLLARNTSESMRTELELKAAATMEPQSDIRDRTPGRLALPGAFGYAFSQSERLDFNSDEQFLELVKNVTDGRYFVYSYNSKLFPGRDSFYGIIDVVSFPDAMSDGDSAETDKGLFFYSRYQSNSDQPAFYAQYDSSYTDGVTSWGMVSVKTLGLTPELLSEYLSSLAGAGPYFQYPGLGVPVLAVYRGATSGDTGQQIWQELQSGKWGEIALFTVTPEMIAEAKEAKKREIELWRTEQEAQPFTFEWSGRTWNAGPDSMARLSPVVMASKSDTARDVMVWGGADNRQVRLSMPQLEELVAAMAQAQVERNDEIYQRQRDMKEKLKNLDDLRSIREMTVSED
ncbi:DUF4376 domain-containing protein [Klebsiella pneumoniae]